MDGVLEHDVKAKQKKRDRYEPGRDIPEQRILEPALENRARQSRRSPPDEERQERDQQRNHGNGYISNRRIGQAPELGPGGTQIQHRTGIDLDLVDNRDNAFGTERDRFGPVGMFRRVGLAAQIDDTVLHRDIGRLEPWRRIHDALEPIGNSRIVDTRLDIDLPDDIGNGIGSIRRLRKRDGGNEQSHRKTERTSCRLSKPHATMITPASGSIGRTCLPPCW